MHALFSRDSYVYAPILVAPSVVFDQLPMLLQLPVYVHVGLPLHHDVVAVRLIGELDRLTDDSSILIQGTFYLQ